MNDAGAWEQRLIRALDNIELTQADLTPIKRPLEGWLSAVTQTLAGRRLQRPQALNGTHALARQVDEVNDLLTASPKAWAQQWTMLAPAQQLADAFDDKVMLLVFGKFNAGKSSLCNLLAERFVAHGRAVSYFHLEAGRIIETMQPLHEGATETTTRLQGVCLGDKLLLLDTPGLHSVTLENAALTQRFTDSADAVLWLTSSTSPGQVQELNELARELNRHKPLLPVITRSDVIEEDEVDGEIVNWLRNKTPANRLLQEQEVQLRAQDKLLLMHVAPTVLKPPVSVSVHVAREQGQTVQALEEGGFARFYAALVDLVEPACAYKQRKPAEVLLHHLEENVLGTIESSVQPALSQLVSQLSQERERLHKLQPRLVSLVWREVVPELPRLLDHYAHDAHDAYKALARNEAGLCRELEGLLDKTLAHLVSTQLGDYDVRLPEKGACLSTGLPLDRCDEVVFDNDCNANSGAAATSVWPLTLSHEQLHDTLQKSIHQQLVQQLEAVFKPCLQALDQLEISVIALQELLENKACELIDIKRVFFISMKPALDK